MSYILDALKRADAERGRGSVPGLHAQPLPGTVPERKGTRISLRTWLGVAIILALAGLAAGTWVWRTQAGAKPTPVAVTAGPVAAPPMPQAAPAQTPVPADTAQPPAAPAQPAPPLPAPAQPTRRVEPALPAAPATRASAAALIAPAPSVTIPAKSKAQAGPVSATASAPVTATTTGTATATATAMPNAGASAAAPAAKPASAAAVAPAIAPLLSELPEEIRRLIPALTITGAVYSENPAQRLLLVNGQVLPQGASAASEVNIEEIRPRSATFSFRGTRFRVTY